ncbi:MAG: ABC transporter permease [Rhodothermales bacterium]
MFRNYLKIAFRNLFRYKGYALVNILGLAVGIAACLIILRYVQFERSFDLFHSKVDRIHRVERLVNNPSGLERWAYTPRDIAQFLKASYPEVEESTRLSRKDEPLVQFGETRFFESKFLYGDPSFFNVFDLAVLQGTAKDLSRPNTVMLTTPTAQKYFGSENPIGKTLEVSNKWDQQVELYEVVGIVDDLPDNSHFAINFLASMATFDSEEDMSRFNCQTYVLLHEEGSISAFTEKLANLDMMQLNELYKNSSLQTIPLSRIHLYGESRDSTDIQLQGDIRLVYLFSLIALLIIVLACINYMNLATARAAQRAREVGVRKVVGARRFQLMMQFIGESLVFVAIGLVLGIVLSQLTLPWFNNMLNQSFSFEWQNAEFLSAVLIGSLMLGLVAGSYPAFLLSGFEPGSVLKGILHGKTMPALRKSLVVFQFAVSIGFIAATFIIYQQLNYVTSQRLGFDQEQRLVLLTRSRLGDQAPAFKEALMRHAAVKQVSLSSGIPGHPSGISFYTHASFEGAQGGPDDHVVFDHLWVDHEYIETFGLNLIAGRSFSNSMATDKEESLILNETAVRELGLENPVGTAFSYQGAQKKVIGVVSDFHLYDLRQEVRPMILDMDDHSKFVTINLATSDVQSSLASFEKVWDEFIPELPFQYAFLDDEVESMYREERRLGSLFSVFSGLAVFVACLGLFGLAAYTSLLRTKEIGIRKILGANTATLVRLLSGEYLKLVVIAFLVAAPLAYYVMSNWLQTFAYKIELSAWIFIGAGLVAFLIAIGTVSFQSLKTALANPVDALRQD